MGKQKRENKKINSFLNEVKTNPQKKAFVVLGGYFIFFLLLIVLIRTNSTPSVHYHDDSNSDFFYLEALKKSNYHFKYSVSIDSDTSIYEGEKTKRNSLFTYSKNDMIENFFEEDNIYYKKQDQDWVSVDNPYILSTLFDSSNIEKILEDATYVSKTEYRDEKQEYHYEITTTSLLKILNREIADLDLPVNTIKVILNHDELEQLDFDFSSYMNYLNLSQEVGKISFVFSKYGSINDIKNPMINETS